VSGVRRESQSVCQWFLYSNRCFGSKRGIWW